MLLLNPEVITIKTGNILIFLERLIFYQDG
jgi:hypothetical protein